MYYLVNVDCNGMAAHLPEVTVKGFKKCCIPNAMDGTDDMCGMAVKMGLLEVSVRKMKALTVTVTLIGKGR